MNAASILRSRVITTIASGAFVSMIGLPFVSSESRYSPVLADHRISFLAEKGSCDARSLQDCNETKVATSDQIVPASDVSSQAPGHADDFIFTAPLTSEF